MIKNLGGEISYLRIQNSLDNREIEYWFSILKTEFLSDINYKKITLRELEKEIAKFVNFYNNDRIQSNLNWKTPKEYYSLVSNI
ncbi:IS3 family transposase [Mycoplasmopsis gallinarum]